MKIKSAKLLKTATYLSCLAYQEPVDIEKEISNDFENFIWIENKDTDTQLFFCNDEKNIYITVRGTEFTNLKDWFTNLDCRFVKPWFKENNFYALHNGFYSDADSVYKEILHHMAIKFSLAHNIVFTGHSQGAAVATMLAVIFSRKFCFDKLISIESPRCMDTMTAEIFGAIHGEKIHLIRNNNDIVPRVPPTSWNYSHIQSANLVYFKESGEAVDNISSWEAFKDRISGRLQDLFEPGLDGLKDHYCAEEILRLVNALEE